MSDVVSRKRSSHEIETEDPNPVKRRKLSSIIKSEPVNEDEEENHNIARPETLNVTVDFQQEEGETDSDNFIYIPVVADIQPEIERIRVKYSSMQSKLSAAQQEVSVLRISQKMQNESTISELQQKLQQKIQENSDLKHQIRNQKMISQQKDRENITLKHNLSVAHSYVEKFRAVADEQKLELQNAHETLTSIRGDRDLALSQRDNAISTNHRIADQYKRLQKSAKDYMNVAENKCQQLQQEIQSWKSQRKCSICLVDGIANCVLGCNCNQSENRERIGHLFCQTCLDNFINAPSTTIMTQGLQRYVKCPNCRGWANTLYRKVQFA